MEFMPSNNSNNWKHIVLRAFGRAWFAGSAVALPAFVFFAFMDGDNPLYSDDPYIAGLLCGMVAAIFAVLYSIIERIPKIARYKGFFCGMLLLIWCSIFFIGDLMTPNSECPGVGILIATFSFISGVAAWILCKLRLPRWFILLVSSGGVLLLIMYGVVCFRMAQRY